MKPFRQMISARGTAGEQSEDQLSTGPDPATPAVEQAGASEPAASEPATDSEAEARPAPDPDGSRPGLSPPRPGLRGRLWEVLVELGFVEEHQVLEAEALARSARQDLGQVLLDRELVTGEQLARAVAQREGLAFVDLDAFEVEERATSLITPAVAERYGAVLIAYGPNGDLLLAVSNPRDRHVINDMSMMVEPNVTPVVATKESLDALIARLQEGIYEDGAEETGAADSASAELVSDDMASGSTQDDATAAPTAPAASNNGSAVDVGDQDVDWTPAPAPPSGSAEVDSDVLRSLASDVRALESAVRESAVSDGESERAALAAAEHRLDELREELARERSERGEAERGLHETIERERAERAEAERRIREELETERAAREAIAAELADVRTARDDLARRVASARDLLELGARPFVPLHAPREP